jgi:beta-N-acetylhexosaminidase
MKSTTLLLLSLLLALSGCGPVGKDPTVMAPEPIEQVQPQQEPVTPVPEPEPEPEPDPVEARLDALMADMTPEEKVGQIFLVRCPEVGAAALIEQYQPGGYILFGRDFENKSAAQVIAMLEGYQSAAKTPMLMAVDEEGGTVCRVSRNRQLRSSSFLSPSYLYNQGGFDLIRSDTQEKCALLRSLGLNVNMAPVCDVTLSKGAFMAQRAFGVGAAETAEYAGTVVSEMKSAGTGSVLKHFPGYGDAADSHTAVTRDSRERSVFETSDFLPFKAGIEAGADAVLVCHNIVDAFDAEVPASLSPAVHQVLRDELGFDGVIVTDDLMMDAIRKSYTAQESAVLAVLAGNDLLCCSEYDAQIPAVREAVESGRIPMETLDAAVRRVLRWKLELGLIPMN